MILRPFLGVFASLLAFLTLFPLVYAQGQTKVGDEIYVVAQDAAGNKMYVPENRQPALYTQTFGDCLGGSLLDITRFDAAYYQDNMTVVFHLQGSTPISNQTLMMYIGVFAYGESRFDLTFNPCNANINSLCPTNASIPIEASGIIPVAQSDVAGIPPIALSIPDFEGQAILRIFSNATQSEIACFSAIVANGNTMSHPSAVGTVAGILTFVAMISSFLTAAYGDHIPTTRTHYAHSLSMFVVFAIYHHVFFTGALSMNWPSVLPAFWSNFAWSAGMIYWDSMQASINRLLGSNFGNTTAVGAASTGSSSESTGGGYDISKIYRRGLEGLFRREPSRFQDIVDNIAARENAPHSFAKRSLMNSTSGFLWYGNPVTPGLPLPGNYSGFAGTLSSHNIPASNAFMTGFLWFLILILIIGGAVVLFKWTLEGMSRFNMVKKDRLAFFRRYWVGFTALAIARMLFIGFFAMTFLTLFQFVYKGPVGVTVIAVLVFLIFFVGVLGISGLSVYYRLQTGTISRTPDRIRIEISKVLGCIPWIGFTRESVRSKQSTPRRTIGSLPWIKLTFVEHNGMHLDDVHHDERYIKRYGWLSARFRKSRWWFSVCWLSYELIRACFYGGAAGHPQVQVFGLLIVEIFGLILIVALKPFEGNRLNVFMVYLLGLSKVITVALSSAFDARFALPRILTTAIGVVIIVVQGLLLAALMIAILIGAVSSYMSLTRNRETFHPEAWLGLREKYFQHINRAATDRPRTPPPPPKLPEEPKATHFNVGTIKRLPKIEDDEDKEAGDFDPYGSRISVIGDDFHGVNYHRNSKGTSIHSNRSLSNLPFGARPHRSSWSSKDFVSYHESQRNSIMMSPVTSPLSLEARRSDPSLRDGYTIRPTSRAPSYGSGPTIEARRSRPSTKLGSSSHSSKPMLSEQPDEDTQSSKV